MPETTTLHEARTALTVVSARTERLLESLCDTGRPIRGSTWTVREAAVHLALVGFRYAGLAVGEPNAYPSLDPEACARLHDQLNADIPESDPVKLGGLVHEATARLVAATASCHDRHHVRFHGDALIAVPRLVGAVLAEHLLHAADMALAVGRPWPIESGHAALALSASGPGYGLGCPSASQPRERNIR
jgi:hypothetical protein